ncbi:MAG: hypothetical protein FD138_3636 [Planctomycetota bacterium]|nr:MAG: hypothetical protein FD138_3636 [Planctomycetota bacterium]
MLSSEASTPKSSVGVPRKYNTSVLPWNSNSPSTTSTATPRSAMRREASASNSWIAGRSDHFANIIERRISRQRREGFADFDPSRRFNQHSLTVTAFERLGRAIPKVARPSHRSVADQTARRIPPIDRLVNVARGIVGVLGGVLMSDFGFARQRDPQLAIADFERVRADSKARPADGFAGAQVELPMMPTAGDDRLAALPGRQ